MKLTNIITDINQSSSGLTNNTTMKTLEIGFVAAVLLAILTISALFISHIIKYNIVW
jgi:hypothetical protein